MACSDDQPQSNPTEASFVSRVSLSQDLVDSNASLSSEDCIQRIKLADTRSQLIFGNVDATECARLAEQKAILAPQQVLVTVTLEGEGDTLVRLNNVTVGRIQDQTITRLCNANAEHVEAGICALEINKDSQIANIHIHTAADRLAAVKAMTQKISDEKAIQALRTKEDASDLSDRVATLERGLNESVAHFSAEEKAGAKDVIDILTSSLNSFKAQIEALKLPVEVDTTLTPVVPADTNVAPVIDQPGAPAKETKPAAPAKETKPAAPAKETPKKAEPAKKMPKGKKPAQEEGVKTQQKN